MSRIRQRLARRDDAGFAMLTVLLAMVILTLMGSLLLLEGMRALPQARHAQDFSAALGAAEAGIDDYMDRLDQNYNYATAPDGNAAFTSFVPIAANSPASYTYRVDTSALEATGGIDLTVTGRVGNVTRTVKVGLRPYGFLDALNQTDYNLVDPLYYPVINNSVADTTKYCAYHAYDANPYSGTRGPYPYYCDGLLNYWISGNVLNGPMQSNDDFYLCGDPKFNDTVDSGDPDVSRAPYWKDPAACAGDAPKFLGGPPRGQHLIGFPPSSAAIKSTVTPNEPGDGCLYTGPTSIQLNGTTMTVVSPDTLSTSPNCVGTNVPLPANGTIYVQDIPGAGDPNNGPCQVTVSWSGSACPQGDAFVQGVLSGELTIAADNNIVITGNVTYDSTTVTNPRRVLGLIATNSVLVNHPVAQGTACGFAEGSTDYCNVTGTVAFNDAVSYTVPLVNPTINAAILSLQHSFSVMNFGRGPAAGLGDVNLTGSIAGRYMDTEGTFGGGNPPTAINGYGVNYSYDKRLRNGGLVPPNFLDPLQTFWHRVSFTECGNGSTTTSC